MQTLTVSCQAHQACEEGDALLLQLAGAWSSCVGCTLCSNAQLEIRSCMLYSSYRLYDVVVFSCSSAMQNNSVAVLCECAVVAGARDFTVSVLVMHVRDNRGMVCSSALGIEKSVRCCMAYHLFKARCSGEVERASLSKERLCLPVPLVWQGVVENGCVVLVLVPQGMSVPERLVEFVGLQVCPQLSSTHCVWKRARKMLEHGVIIKRLAPEIYGSESIEASLVQLGQESIWLDAQRAQLSIDPGMLLLMLREMFRMARICATHPQQFTWRHWPTLEHGFYFGVVLLFTRAWHLLELGCDAVPGPIASAEDDVRRVCWELLCS